ncbi:hypothetical protein [Nitrincola tapanii]|uniref:Uncharacterized protein n=1 Tax=Nitrincola tapanii TaxID=1708751 RepID=A0A5A9W509_9GAMM|nr:hypothetical protein [Nitrincola tapanii]KAA0875827.1 hypothetical protein E1H14_03845 [Nitrincola tapanii]
MEWFISIVVMLSIIGSLMYVMPSPRERMQSAMRLHARQLGFSVQLVQLELPRAKGELEPQKIRIPVYRSLRPQLSSEAKDTWRTWQVCRVENVANQGLLPGWSWKLGEGCLQMAELDQLNALLEQLPASVLALESTPIHFSVFWRESGGVEGLDALHSLIQPRVQAKW